MSCACTNRASLDYAGYRLGDKDAFTLLSGVGTDGKGLLDASEVLQAVADALQESQWRAEAAEAAMSRRPAVTPRSIDGDYLRGTAYVSPSRSEREAGSKKRKAASRVLVLAPPERKVVEELSAKGKGELTAKLIMKPFQDRDPFGDGAS
jgi:hypothetical protein